MTKHREYIASWGTGSRTNNRMRSAKMHILKFLNTNYKVIMLNMSEKAKYGY